MAVALPCDKGSEVAKFDTPQINAVTTSFLYVPSPVAQGGVPPPHPLDPSLSRGFGGAETTVQNYTLFSIRQKNIFHRVRTNW